MQILNTGIIGCFIIKPKILRDERGIFVKIFNEKKFQEHGLETHFAEDYYSKSKNRVLRGLHFQTPPYDHSKLVYCSVGEVLDIALDVRVGSPSYGKSMVIILNSECGDAIYLPSGIAHGFYTLSHEAIMTYKVSSVYEPTHDSGILWKSAGIQLPDNSPIISKRDNSFLPLEKFNSPFIFDGLKS